MHNLFKGRSPIILRGRREKGMYQSTHDKNIRFRFQDKKPLTNSKKL